MARCKSEISHRTLQSKIASAPVRSLAVEASIRKERAQVSLLRVEYARPLSLPPSIAGAQKYLSRLFQHRREGNHLSTLLLRHPLHLRFKTRGDVKLIPSGSFRATRAERSSNQSSKLNPLKKGMGNTSVSDDRRVLWHR